MTLTKAMPAINAEPKTTGTVPGVTRWRRAFAWTGYAIVALLTVFVGAGTLAPVLLGYHSTTVYGGSMGSSLPAGSIAVTGTVRSEEVRVGDIVAFARRGDTATVMHRVTGIEERDAQRLATLRGDMNGAADPEPLLLSGNGDRLVYYVPFLGYVVHYSRTATFLVFAAGCLASALAWEQVRMRRMVAAPLKEG